MDENGCLCHRQYSSRSNRLAFGFYVALSLGSSPSFRRPLPSLRAHSFDVQHRSALAHHALLSCTQSMRHVVSHELLARLQSYSIESLPLSSTPVLPSPPPHSRHQCWMLPCILSTRKYRSITNVFIELFLFRPLVPLVYHSSNYPTSAGLRELGILSHGRYGRHRDPYFRVDV